MSQRKVVVVGAGVVGVVTAEALGERGYAVTVLERNREAAAGTSAGNAGQLCGAFCLPFGAPGFFASFVQRSLAGLGSGMRPVDVLKNLRWLSRFIRNSGQAAYVRNSETMLRLAAESVDALDALLRRNPVEFDYRKHCGKLYLYENPKALESANLLLDLRRRMGFDARALSEDECRQIEPLLAQSRYRYGGGIYSADSSVGNCALFTRNLASRLQANGVVFRYGAVAEKLVVQQGKVRGVALRDEVLDADLVILASATGTRALLPARLARRFPVAPLKGYSVSLPLRGPAPSGTISDTRRAVAFSVLGDKLRVSGGAYLNSSMDPSGREIDRILDVARHTLPDAADYDAGRTQGWAGLRPVTPTSAPYIGRTDLEGLYMNTGHGGFGWTCAAASAQRLMTVIE